MNNTFKNIIVLFLLSIFFIACNRENDICENGEATPRVKIKFKTQSTGKLKTLDSVFVKIDYGNGAIGVLENKKPTDSLLLPLRVDDVEFTELYIGVNSTDFSKVRISYQTENKYVSPACGVKKTYVNTSAQVITQNPVLSIQQNQNEITDEKKTHFFLLF